MNPYYDKIMQLKGVEELQALIRKWNTLSENLHLRSFDAPILLPDVFLYTYSGAGHTKMLELIANFLDSRKNLMSFYGDVKFFEFKLGYNSPNERFTELYRFADTVSAAAGFRNEYRGVIRVNVDEWVNHCSEKHFIEFLSYLQESTDSWLIFLTVSNQENAEKAHEMEAVVSMYLRIETVTIQRPSTQDLVEYAREYVNKYGLEIDASGAKVLEEALEVLRKNKHFYGYHTVGALCSDIVYTLFSQADTRPTVLTAQLLREFSAESPYIKRSVIRKKQAATIGF